MKWVTESLGLLRREINSTPVEISDEMISTVVVLSGIEVSTCLLPLPLIFQKAGVKQFHSLTYANQLGWGTFEKFSNHRHGMNQMVKLRGGLNNVGWLQNIVHRQDL